jgi:hypothetical protein
MKYGVSGIKSISIACRYMHHAPCHQQGAVDGLGDFPIASFHIFSNLRPKDCLHAGLLFSSV